MRTLEERWVTKKGGRCEAVDDVIPPDVRDFIIRNIDTVSQLEALLMLRANPDESWEAGRIASRVYASDRELGDVLERFTADGFVRRDGDLYRYDAKDPAVVSTIGELARYYTSHLIPVTNMIHAKPRSMRSFSDAFKLRKET
jgi:hypothetical protein